VSFRDTLGKRRSGAARKEEADCLVVEEETLRGRKERHGRITIR